MKFRQPLQPSNAANLAPTNLPTKRKHWSTEEDQAIIALVSQTSDCKWTEIAHRLESEFSISGRSGKQCRERWHNHLNPEISKKPWSLQEEKTLFNSHQELGNIWAYITQLLPGRSENAIKNHFYSSLRRQFRKFKGGEPTRKQLKKYDMILTAQILTVVNKKIKHQSSKIEVVEPLKVRSLDDIEPIECCSEDSTLWGEPEYFFSIDSLF